MPTLWIDTLISTAVGSGGQIVLPLSPVGLSTVERRLTQNTLLRTIVRLDLAATVRDSGEGDNIVDLGIALLSIESSGATSGAPDPSSQGDFPVMPWVWRSRYRVYAVAVDDQNTDVIRIDLDLRGRRKIGNGQLHLIVDNTANQGTAVSVTPTGLIRTLLLVG